MANPNGENKNPETKAPTESPKAEAPKVAEPRNLTREMLADQFGEEEARKRIP